MFKEETLRQIGSREYEEPDGEFLELVESGNNTLTVLTRVDSDKGGERIDPSSLTVSELEDRLEEGDFSEETLLALHKAEQQGKDRTTALNAIEDRL